MPSHRARLRVHSGPGGEPDENVDLLAFVSYDKDRLGIVEYDPFTSIPKNHRDFFVSELPDAESCFIGDTDAIKDSGTECLNDFPRS